MVKITKTRRRIVKKTKKKTTPTILGRAFRSLGGLGGGALGSLIGMPTTGAAYGTGLGASLSKWLGSGDYSIRSNSLVNSFEKTGSIPAMHSTGQSIVVRHKEYLCDVVAGTGTPTAFNICNEFELNPGLESTFPWLSSIAQQYQEYSWRGMVFHYKPTSGNSVASTNTALGNVMVHTDYRVTAPAPVSKVELLNEYFASDSIPSEEFCHPIECDPKENPYNVQYVRTGAVPSGEDPKTYDLGITRIATKGIPAAATVLGEIWVSYEVELKKPQITGSNSQSVKSAMVAGDGTAPTTSSLCGSAPLYQDNFLGVTLAGKTVTIPAGSAGTYLLTFGPYGSGITATVAFSAVTAVTNCTTVTGELIGTTYMGPALSAVAFTGTATQAAIIRVDDPTSTSTFTIDYTTLTNFTDFRLIITDLHETR